MEFKAQRRKAGFTKGLMPHGQLLSVPGVKPEENCGGKSDHNVCASSIIL